MLPDMCHIWSGKKKQIVTQQGFMPVKYNRFNSLTTGRCGNNYKSVIFEHTLWIKFMGISCEIARKWMTQSNFDDEWALV